MKSASVRRLTAELTCSSFHPASFPRDRLPEIAFAGRSNVGKSSLINFLLGERNLAHTSGTPGKTTGINFYKVNRTFYLVDLPGYGFSKVPKSLRENWKRLTTGYLQDREALLLTVLLVDARIPPTDLDLQMRDWLVSLGKEFMVVLTKTDKISRAKIRTLVQNTSHQMQSKEIICCSTKSGTGRRELLRFILSLT